LGSGVFSCVRCVSRGNATKLTDSTFDLGVIDLTALDHFRRGIPGIFCHPSAAGGGLLRARA